MPKVYKVVRLYCHVCRKEYRFSVKDSMFIAINEAEPGIQRCLWCASFIDAAQTAYIKELRRATTQRA